MTGKVISFKSHRRLKRGRRCREQTVPRHVPAAGRSKHPSRSSDPADVVPEAPNTQILELQLAHIAHLLVELEELAGSSETCPPAAQTPPRARIEKACRVLPPLEKSERTAPLAGGGAGDPQPEIDDEELKRMYLDLYSDA